MWPRFVARFNREKRGRQVRQHGRDKGGKRATARELYFRWIHELDEEMYLGHRVLIPSILIILHFFFLLIQFKNYFIFKETKFQSSLFRRIYCLKKMNS